MPTSNSCRACAVAAFTAVLVLASATASGKPPKAKPKAVPAAPAEKLPSGCTRLVDGYGAVPSPDGKAVAYIEASALVSLTFARAGLGDVELRIREEGSDEGRRLTAGARPLGWVDRTLLLDSGMALDPKSGTRAAKVASIPNGTEVAAVAWTRDGKRLAWVPLVATKSTTSVRVLGADGREKVLDGTEGIRTDQNVLLAWAPDGSKVYVNGLFKGDGAQPPVRKVALIDPVAGAMTVLATMPDWISIPGLQSGIPAYRDPRIENPKEIDLTWEPAPEPRYGSQVFSGDGRLVAWLAGTGWIEADAFVADVATGQVMRVTNDGEAKWSPAMDPTGRRLAFCTADGLESSIGIRGAYRRARIRILDLMTGEPSDVELAMPGGVPARLTWTPDGKGLLYDVRTLWTAEHVGGTAKMSGTFLQAVASPGPKPAAGKILSVEHDPRNRIVAWLGSYDADRVHTAVHRAEDAWDPYYLPALTNTLNEWKDRESVVVPCLVHVFDLKQTKEVVPNLRAALGTKIESNRTCILVALLHLGESDAIEGLERIRRETKDKDLRLEVALAMVKAGDDRGWPSIAEAAKSGDHATRRELCRALALVRHAKSVEILIPLVADRKPDPSLEKLRKLGVKVPDRLVAPVAEWSLRTLTGKDFGDSAAKWTAWWKTEAGQRLPSDVPPVPEPED